jgi:D-inositol-3-phosphate glycosyltransferase
MRKLLWVGDAACESGFARATHNTLETLRHTWDVVVLGLNYLGDPHHYPYRIFPCFPGGDGFGVGRIAGLVQGYKPDLVVIQNDPWNVEIYLEQLAEIPHKPKLMGAMAVDGKNCRGNLLNGLDGVIFWTRFAKDEAFLGGLRKTAWVIPLGVDQSIYYPMDKEEAREAVQLPGLPPGAFIIGFVGRNQPRKRMDLLIDYFAEWVKRENLKDEPVYLFLHVAPTGDVGYNVPQLWQYHLPQEIYGKHLIWIKPDPRMAPNEHYMRLTYNCFDVHATCTQGEGMGLPQLESMACGVPNVFPDWSALGDWARDGGLPIPCSSTAATVGGPNAIGGIPDREKMIEAFSLLYRDRQMREHWGASALRVAQRSQYDWKGIGQEWERALSFITETECQPA